MAAEKFNLAERATQIDNQTVSLTENYDLSGSHYQWMQKNSVEVHVNQKKRNNLPELYPILSGLRAQVNWNDEGEFVGLENRNNVKDSPPYHLQCWFDKDQATEVLVRYTVDDLNPVQARITGIFQRDKSKGRSDTPFTNVLSADDQDAVLNILNIPRDIDVAETMHRMVWGVDLQTGNPLTDQDISQRPLVPFSQN